MNKKKNGTQSIFFYRVNNNAGIESQQTSKSVWSMAMENMTWVFICVDGLVSEETV